VHYGTRSKRIRVIHQFSHKGTTEYCGTSVLLAKGMPAQKATFQIKTDKLYEDFECEESKVTSQWLSNIILKESSS